MPNRQAAARMRMAAGLSDSYTAARVGGIDRGNFGSIDFDVGL